MPENPKPEYWHQRVQRGGEEISAFIQAQLADKRQARAAFHDALTTAAEENAPAEENEPDPQTTPPAAA